jgi:hypothetical protein
LLDAGLRNWMAAWLPLAFHQELRRRESYAKYRGMAAKSV